MNETPSRAALLKRSALLVGLLLLAACSGAKERALKTPCPKVTTLGEASTLTRYMDGPGRDLIDIDFTGRISNLSGKCLYEMEYGSDEGVVSVSVYTEFRITRGAANKTHKATFDYFVSLIDSEGVVLEKLVFPFTAEFWNNRSFMIGRDNAVDVVIPLKGGKNGEDFEIYVGFQLSQEELDFNRGKILK